MFTFKFLWVSQEAHLPLCVTTKSSFPPVTKCLTAFTLVFPQHIMHTGTRKAFTSTEVFGLLFPKTLHSLPADCGITSDVHNVASPTTHQWLFLSNLLTIPLVTAYQPHCCLFISQKCQTINMMKFYPVTTIQYIDHPAQFKRRLSEGSTIG